MKLEITTPYGDRYIVHENSHIERTDIEGFCASENWRFLGLSHAHPFNREFVSFRSVIEALRKNPAMFATYKNGNPRYTVRDFDYGTIREWGNTKHHGVKTIRLID